MSKTTFQRVWWGLFGIGLVISLVMVFRSRLDGDQLNMLVRGWYLAFAGEWKHVGMPTSAGGWSPGGLLALLVGLPLKIWPDDRAATLVVWMSGVVGYLILDRIVGRALGPSGRLLFAVFYWLNPWRVHFTSSLWNTNYAFALGAIHCWAAFALRRGRKFWPTMVMVLIPAVGFQIHSAAVVFGFASVFLWWRRLIKVNWWGIAAGGVATLALYLPWILMVANRPELLPGGTGFPFRNLILVHPLVKGLIYLLRYSSLALPGRVYEIDLMPNGTTDEWLSMVLSVALVAIGWVSVVLPLVAYRRLLRGRRSLVTRIGWSGSDRRWLRGYVVWSLVGAAAAFGFSPTSVMFWQGFPVFHSASLVVVFFVATLLRSGFAGLTRRLVVGWLVASLITTVLVCVGSPMFRPSGPAPGVNHPDGDYVQRITRDHPMFHDLNLHDRCGFVIVGDGGFMPDLLREPAGPEK